MRKMPNWILNSKVATEALDETGVEGTLADGTVLDEAATGDKLGGTVDTLEEVTVDPNGDDGMTNTPSTSPTATAIDINAPEVSSAGSVVADTDGDAVINSGDGDTKGSTGGEMIEGGDTDAVASGLATFLKPFDGESIASTEATNSTAAAELDVLDAMSDDNTLDTDGEDLDDDAVALENIAIIAMESLRHGGLSEVAYRSSLATLKSKSKRWNLPSVNVAALESRDENRLVATRLLADAANVACEGIAETAATWVNEKVESVGRVITSIGNVAKGYQKEADAMKKSLEGVTSDKISFNITAKMVLQSDAMIISIPAAAEFVNQTSGGVASIKEVLRTEADWPKPFPRRPVKDGKLNVMRNHFVMFRDVTPMSMPGAVYVSRINKDNGDELYNYQVLSTSIMIGAGAAIGTAATMSPIGLVIGAVLGHVVSGNMMLSKVNKGEMLLEVSKSDAQLAVTTVHKLIAPLEAGIKQWKNSSAVTEIQAKIKASDDKAEIKELKKALKSTVRMYAAMFTAYRNIATGNLAIVSRYLRLAEAGKSSDEGVKEEVKED